MILKLAAQQISNDLQLPLNSLFETLALSRATHYRRLARPLPTDPDMELRDHIQRFALDWPQYGYRRVTAELHRQGVEANHKRVLRLMREDNLLCLRKRRFLSTTKSRHSLTVYPNLVPEVRLSSINQLWDADITYIRLLRECIYLAVILDGYSRRCIGWALVETGLALRALQMALASRK